MLQEWEDIHVGPRSSDGVLSTEINHAVGEDAVTVENPAEPEPIDCLGVPLDPDDRASGRQVIRRLQPIAAGATTEHESLS